VLKVVRGLSLIRGRLLVGWLSERGLGRVVIILVEVEKKA